MSAEPAPSEVSYLSDRRKHKAVEPDPRHTTEFLRAVYAGVPGGFSVSWIHPGSDRLQSTYCEDLDTVSDEVLHLSKDGATSIYLRTTTLDGRPKKRGKVEDSLAFPGLWADLDFGKVGHKHEDREGRLPLPPDAEKARLIVKAAALPPPTLWINSGGGLYAWWLLDTHLDVTNPSDLRHCKEFSRAWQAQLKAGAATLNYDYGAGVGDLARVLRVPGTVNLKDASRPRPCVLEALGAEGLVEGSRYTYDALSDALEWAQELVEPLEATGPGSAGPMTDDEAEMARVKAAVDPGPFDVLAQTVGISGVLLAAGWQECGCRSGKGTGIDMCWTRPGGGSTTDCSAVVYEDQPNVLVVFSENAHPLPSGDGQRLTAGKIFTWLHHSDNGRNYDSHAAAIDILAAQRGKKSGTEAARKLRDHGLPLISAEEAIKYLDDEGQVPEELLAALEEDVEGLYDPDDIMEDAFLGWLIAHTYMKKDYRTYGKTSWARWDGKRWKIGCDPDEIRNIVEVSMLRIYKKCREEAEEYLEKKLKRIAASGGEPEVVEAATAAAKKSMESSLKKVKSRLTSSTTQHYMMTQVRQHLRVAFDQFDGEATQEYLNCPNGVVNLRTGELQPHGDETKAMYFTKMAGANYVPGRSHPDWDKALLALPDDAHEYLQKRFGQAATGRAPEDDIVLFLRGGGENGKTTFLAGLAGALGEFSGTMPKQLLQSGRQHDSLNLNLRGVRFAVIEELPGDKWLDDERLKSIDGTSEMTGRQMNETLHLVWKPTHTLVCSTNHRINVPATDHGTWRRLMEVLFPHTFGGKDKTRAGDAGLRPRLERGAGGVWEAVLAWVVEGAVQWLDRVPLRSEQPDSVVEATAVWRGEGNPTIRFFEQCLVVEEGAGVLTSDVYECYKAWCKEGGSAPLSDQTFWVRADSVPMMKTPGVARGQQRVGSARVMASRVVKNPERMVRGLTLSEQGVRLVREAKKSGYALGPWSLMGLGELGEDE